MTKHQLSVTWMSRRLPVARHSTLLSSPLVGCPVNEVGALNSVEVA